MTAKTEIIIWKPYVASAASPLYIDISDDKAGISDDVEAEVVSITELSFSLATEKCGTFGAVTDSPFDCPRILSIFAVVE